MIEIAFSSSSVDMTVQSGQSFNIDIKQEPQIEMTFPLVGVVGADGLSAYQVALQEGFIGTESDWLASLGGNSTGIFEWSNINW